MPQQMRQLAAELRSDRQNEADLYEYSCGPSGQTKSSWRRSSAATAQIQSNNVDKAEGTSTDHGAEIKFPFGTERAGPAIELVAPAGASLKSVRRNFKAHGLDWRLPSAAAHPALARRSAAE